jgi:plasmid stabilization system protein ParE
MDFEVRWTTTAADDLAAIFAHLAEIDPHAAERQGKAILDHIELLRAFPKIGPRYRKRSRGEIREILCGNYRVFYRLHEQSRYVEILRIFHGARQDPEIR